MTTIQTIVSLVAIAGSLILVTSGGALRTIKFSQAARMALIWAIIIVGLVLLIDVLGYRGGSF